MRKKKKNERKAGTKTLEWLALETLVELLSVEKILLTTVDNQS